jgi:hypothetical protein
VGLVQVWTLTPVAAWAGSFPTAGRCLIAVVVIFPLALLMGFPMPSALARLNRGAPSLVPWAWGVNGFASVLAAPLATIVGMAVGFRSAALIAVGLYVVAAAVYARLPERAQVLPYGGAA